ncbi:MucBP domain-containing protein [Weissella coleopterorum]|uniref:MucBP domain-containing protein n=1 Tax=Weissella coleopterorum TaxID=2714949 RepID=A0A6G8AZG8_9LACO|nr:MucBP domain-containing protein [Weissella coleopterorum]QIL50491.1 MucBP domain-containing protein [Weissella coleopterorum]
MMYYIEQFVRNSIIGADFDLSDKEYLLTILDDPQSFLENDGNKTVYDLMISEGEDSDETVESLSSKNSFQAMILKFLANFKTHGMSAEEIKKEYDSKYKQDIHDYDSELGDQADQIFDSEDEGILKMMADSMIPQYTRVLGLSEEMFCNISPEETKIKDEYFLNSKVKDIVNFVDDNGNKLIDVSVIVASTDDTGAIPFAFVDNDLLGADVTVKYVDENGKEIAQSEVKSGNIGDKYTTEKKDIKGYTFKEVKGSESGEFTDKSQTVTYVYTKNPIKAADVKAEYVDENGKEIAQSEVKSGNIGDKYTTEKKDIKGYTFKEVRGSESGEFTDKSQTVTYVYTKNPIKAADVKAEYVDENGKEIAQSEVKSGNIGDKYTTEKKDIKGYTFKKVKGSITGTLSDKAQTVTYIYAKNDDSENQTDPSEPAKPDTPDNSGDTDNPVNNNDSNNADKTTDSNSTIKNVVNNVVEGAQTLLPKTAADKLTLTGVLIAVVVSLAGIIILNKRK